MAQNGEPYSVYFSGCLIRLVQFHSVTAAVLVTPELRLACAIMRLSLSVEISDLVWNDMNPPCYPAVLPGFDEEC
jgi:hypothetical protein